MAAYDIAGFEGLYSITRAGKVYSHRRKRWLNPTVHSNGYVYVGLYSNPKRVNARLHKLVAQTFLPNPDGLVEINHKDGDKANNHVSNLEWSNRSENLLHMYRTRKVCCPNCGTMVSVKKQTLITTKL